MMQATVTPNFHTKILNLRQYAINLNWVQRLFFPTNLRNALQEYDTNVPDIDKAIRIYFRLSKSNGILFWIGKHILSGLKQFTQDLFTQSLVNVRCLDRKYFLQQVNIDDGTYLAPPSTPTSTHSSQITTPTTSSTDDQGANGCRNLYLSLPPVPASETPKASPSLRPNPTNAKITSTKPEKKAKDPTPVVVPPPPAKTNFPSPIANVPFSARSVIPTRKELPVTGRCFFCC
jgi:hypothetical protein